VRAVSRALRWGYARRAPRAFAVPTEAILTMEQIMTDLPAATRAAEAEAARCRMSAALDLEHALRDRRCANGGYIAPEPAPHHKPDTYAPLAAALAEPPDPEHAAEAARHLIKTFPNCRVGKAAYSEGLADIVPEDGIPPCVVR
jgi:hypothetical protein